MWYREYWVWVSGQSVGRRVTTSFLKRQNYSIRPKTGQVTAQLSEISPLAGNLREGDSLPDATYFPAR